MSSIKSLWSRRGLQVKIFVSFVAVVIGLLTLGLAVLAGFVLSRGITLPIKRLVTASPPDVGPGFVLGGRYEIQRVVGSGGMGMVYQARDRELDEMVAIKTSHLSARSRRPCLAGTGHRSPVTGNR